MRSRRVLAAAGAAWACLVTASAADASSEALPAPGELVIAHLQTRQQALARQHEAAVNLARQHAWMAYRLSQKRRLLFFDRSEQRLEQARATTLSLAVLGRSLDEAEKIAAERREVERERERFVVAAATPGPTVGSEKPALVWPVKGPIIAEPGLRADGVTGVVTREPGVQILARVDAPVMSPADGVVRREEALPGGGHALVLAMADGWVAVLTGLRAVNVSVGEQVRSGQLLGRVGRTLDGAPVLRLALWQAGRPVDPRPSPRGSPRRPKRRPRP